jgi:hypothetical protein
MKKKYLLLVLSFVPFALFLIAKCFRTDMAMFCLSVASLFFLVTYVFNKKISYVAGEESFSFNGLFFLIVTMSALLNFFVLFFSAFALRNYHWVLIVIAILLFLLSFIKSFRNLIKTF